MDSLATNLLPFFDWLLRTTCQASLLIVLVVAIHGVLGRRLGVRGRYCLWLVVLLRMAMPWAPQSGVSVHNLLPWSPLEGVLTPVAPQGNKASPNSTSAQISAAEASGGASQSVSASWHQETTIVVLLSAVWLAGVCFLAGCIAAERLRLQRTIGSGRTVTDRRVLDLLEDCKRLIGTDADVRVVTIDGLASPALFGFVRPRLLLPHETPAREDQDELRHIFLHELAHLKRHDILIGHLASVLHVLHWFNPVIALGLRRMRTDVELACDALAMSRLHPGETSAYGQTVIHQIERLLASPQQSVLLGLCGDRTQIKRRIAMISVFEKETDRRSLLAALLVACLACVGLTNGLAGSIVAPPASAWDAYARRHFRTTHQDQHANIQRCCLRNMESGKYLVVDGETVACDADEPGEAGLWELRFDEASNTPQGIMYFYSVAARRYLTSDDRGRLAINAQEPDETTRWAAVPRPEGVWVISHHFKDGYLRPDEQGQVDAVNFGRDERSYWDVHSVWRVKTSDDPKSNPQWQREHIPGLD
jgi:beta-lactamase regulating signal transducer with metallopeptidase domain